MAFETKVILESISKHCLMVDSSRQVYEIVRGMAQVEGVKMPSYDEAKSALMSADKKTE